MNRREPLNRPTPFAIEHLETRRLMAIDLAVEHDTFEPANPGDEVTRVIRVYNHGDDVAEDVLVRSSLTDELELSLIHI